MFACSLFAGGVFLFAMFHSKEDKNISMSEIRVLYIVFMSVCAAGVLCLALLRRPNPVAPIDIESKDTELEMSSVKSKQKSCMDSFGEISTTVHLSYANRTGLT
jgi:hypothetical protein